MVTPLGTIGFRALVEDVAVTALPPGQVLLVAGGGHILCWDLPAFRMELLLCRPKFSLPGGMRVSDCWAGMWRVKAHGDLPSCLFYCGWDPGHRWVEWGPESGEALYAKTWEDPHWKVSIGTEDEEWLAGRARRAAGLPPRLSSYFSGGGFLDALFHCEAAIDDTPDSEDPIGWQGVVAKRGWSGMTAKGIPIPLPEIGTGETCQVHFIVAWAPRVRADDVDTWYAVDREPAEILAGAGCT